jgi:hypothetical protein
MRPQGLNPKPVRRLRKMGQRGGFQGRRDNRPAGRPQSLQPTWPSSMGLGTAGDSGMDRSPSPRPRAGFPPSGWVNPKRAVLCIMALGGEELVTISQLTSRYLS